MRARIIKPGFFKNEELAEIGPTGMLLFAGLWTLADREGRLEDRPKRIKIEVLPYFDCDVNSLLNELAQRGFIDRYEVSGSRFIQIVNWRKHQNPHPKDSESVIPPPPQNFPRTFHGNPRKNSEDPEPSTESHENPWIHDQRSKIKDLSLDQELSRDQEPKIADQTPSLVVNKAITRGESKPKATAPKPAIATRLPDSWPLTPEREQYAIAQGVNPERTHQDFCDYWHAKAGPNARKLDWDATWRTWCRRAAERGYGPSRASPFGSLPGVPMSRAEAVLAAAYQQAVMEEAQEKASLGYDEK